MTKNILANVKLRGLLSYLVTRAKLRFADKADISVKKTINIFGQKVTLNLLDTEQKYLAADCVKEPENLIVYRAISEAGLVNTFIDIGANCGHVAASIINDYTKLVLFEPNPTLAQLLRDIYKGQDKVIVRECAIVDAASVGNLILSVPVDSSGLATLGETHLSKKRDSFHTYNVKTSTLAAEMIGISVKNSYIKIDAEGFEAKIIESAKNLIDIHRPIVGFEALTGQAAWECMKLFDDYVFYCARFDFLEKGGALMRSWIGITKALMGGGKIDILRLDHFDKNTLNNFSQIYSVPREKATAFEDAIISYIERSPVLHLDCLSTWS